MELLVKCKGVDRKKINKLGFTAMDVLGRQTLVDNRKSVKILNSNHHRYSKFFNLEEKMPEFFREMEPETINALLVVFSLVLSMTYQALLSPPGGHGPEGKSVMTTTNFLMFYVSNGVAFLISWVIMMSLFAVVAKNIMFCLWPLYLLMCNSYWFAFFTIAPSNSVHSVVVFAVTILVALFSSISSYRLRKY